MDQWITWNGSKKCPVAHDTLVEITNRAGEVSGPEAGADWCWNWMPSWPEADIVAYRVVSPPPPKIGEDHG